ncbi:unnamed protein product, partial [Linum tenue]
MVTTKSMKAAEKAEKANQAGDDGVDGAVEDLTGNEELRRDLEAQARRQARVEEELGELQERARDHNRTIEALTAAVEALVGQVSGLTEAWKKGGGGDQPPEGKGAAVVVELGGQGAARLPEGKGAGGSGETGGAAVNPSRPTGSRTGQVTFGPSVKDGLLPTPSAQERARARGKAKMAEYVEPDLQTGLDEEELMGLEQEYDHEPWPNELNGPGEDYSRDEGSHMGRAGLEGGPGGKRRETGRGWEVGRPSPMGRGPAGRAEYAGRAGSSRGPSGRVEPGRTEPGRTRTEPGQQPARTGGTGSRGFPARQGQFDEPSGNQPPFVIQQGTGREFMGSGTGDQRQRNEMGRRRGYQEEEEGEWEYEGGPRFSQYYHSEAPGYGRHACYYRGGEAEDDMVFRAKPPTIEFPKFNGREDAGLWIYSAERWFKNHPTR